MALEISQEDDAALTVLAAITQWFTIGESPEVFDELKTKDPSRIIEVLFGFWVASIETVCEMMDCPVEDYLQQVAKQVQLSMVMPSLDP